MAIEHPRRPPQRRLGHPEGRGAARKGRGGHPPAWRTHPRQRQLRRWSQPAEGQEAL